MPLILFVISILVAGVSIDTTFAEKDNDDKLSKHDVDVLCDASEDYEKNKEQCDKLYDIVGENENDD